MNFKDQLKKDLAIFINVDEFGEVHTLGKKEIVMIIDEDDNQEKLGRTRDFEEVTQNIYEATKTIYLKASEYKKPEVGKRIKLDDKSLYVIHSSVMDGILKIVFSANQSYG
ncbi:hypothetical protein B4102_0235 [Heyndrickxia sporothermodurans]|uniref:Uncharacterized protein n=1 Tax=Heyndrickxia sporothermodurans TaxID=46224 RepID=A0A150KSV7_9BACI|nr:hypothetical protein [Heyndrickxia sporothermodurans]KYD02641.1 hypothetical protein B4102_0235 [Heyndrickxia sporothermodurans]